MFDSFESALFPPFFLLSSTTTMFWSSAAVAAKLERMKAAEAKLVAFARRFGGRDENAYEMQLFDTPIPRSVVPLLEQGGEDLSIHGIRLTSKEHSADTIKTPLVIQHGYMNGSLYNYRNLVGLTRHFQSVYAIDMLGWGLSSRPAFRLKDKSTETAEEFFVESLEAWREKNEIDKMILCGHSIGGYLSVAYTEKYPQRVERLILLSPAGVPEKSKQLSRWRENASFRTKLLVSLYSTLFDSGTTPCTVLRTLPSRKAYEYASSYVRNRLPAIQDPEEQTAVTDYLYYNSVLPPSGEQCLNRILQPNVMARKPLLNRIPHLQVTNVSFLYGMHDWMEYTAGVETQVQCQQRRAQHGKFSPSVDVFRVRDAGHLLMLDNWEEVNAGIVASVKGVEALHKIGYNVPISVSALTADRQTTVEGISLNKREAEGRRASVQVEA
jgi:cardiolipin-specific phospholipase